MDDFDKYLFEELTQQYKQENLSYDDYEEIYQRLSSIDYLEEVRPYLLAMRFLGRGVESEEESVLRELSEQLSTANSILRGLYYDFQLLKNPSDQAARVRLSEMVLHGYSNAFLKEDSSVPNGLYTIDVERCVGCGLCARNCQQGAIASTQYIPVGHILPSKAIAPNKCNNCGSCISKCVFHAITKVDLTGQTARARLSEMVLQGCSNEIFEEDSSGPNGLYTIDVERCVGCGLCARNCQQGAIVSTQYIPVGHVLPSKVIAINKCNNCGSCISKCKFHAITKVVPPNLN